MGVAWGRGYVTTLPDICLVYMSKVSATLIALSTKNTLMVLDTTANDIVYGSLIGNDYLK